MNTKRHVLTSFIILLLISGHLAAESLSYGADEGWESTISTGLRETDGWKGRTALTLAPLGRNPFLSEGTGPEGDISPSDIDLLLLAEPEGLENPVGHYRISGDYEISTLFPARGEASLRPGTGGVQLHPSAHAMWAPGREWGDFTLDFRLRPATLRNGEILFFWEGRDENGELQTVIARVENRRLVWEFQAFFRHGADRSLNLKLSSPPLIPGDWAHHRIRFKRGGESEGRSGASPGLLEYLVDGVPCDMVHATPDGREGPEPFSPRIGELSDGPLHLAPSFRGYIDEFRLAPVFASGAPVGGYADRETSASGLGRTMPVDSGYPGSNLTVLRARVDIPGNTRVRFYARAFTESEEVRNAGFPTIGTEGWIPLEMKPEDEDPTGFGRWYSWKADTDLSGRYFVVGYVLDPDPGADLAPVLSALEIQYDPRLPPRPPQDLRWTRDEHGRVQLSWSSDAEEDVTGWWISWGPRPGDYASTDNDEMVRGTQWIPRIDKTGDGRVEYAWPMTLSNSIIYTSLQTAWEEGAPDIENGPPGDYRALSEPTKEMNFRP